MGVVEYFWGNVFYCVFGSEVGVIYSVGCYSLGLSVGVDIVNGVVCLLCVFFGVLLGVNGLLFFGSSV